MEMWIGSGSSAVGSGPDVERFSKMISVSSNASGGSSSLIANGMSLLSLGILSRLIVADSGGSSATRLAYSNRLGSAGKYK